MRDLQKDLEICNKATPGPWERNEKPSFGDWWVCSGGQHICLLPADKKGTYYGEMFRANSDFIAAAREGWPHAIERAIKAEAKLDRLIEGCMRCAGEDDHERFQRLRAEVERLYEINQGCESEAHLYDDLLHRCRTENAKLRAVVEAARVYVMEHDKIPNLRTLDEWIIIVAAIRNALAELDKEEL